MIYKKDNEFILANKKVVFTENDKQKEKVVGKEGVEWWDKLAAKHNHIEIIEFLDITYNQDQLDRFEEVKGLKGDLDEIEEYILNGEVSIDTEKPAKNFKDLKLKKEMEKQQSQIDDVAVQALKARGLM